MAETFIMPDFVLEADAEVIQARMMEALPDDIDDMPGGFPWDFTMPTALIISEFTQSRLVRALKTMFPQYAWGEWLDMHGARVNVTRREARAATGMLHVIGQIGTVIPEGTIFCTPSVNGSKSVLYATDESVQIVTGEVYIPITAQEAGVSGNVMAGAISLAFQPISGIASISNDEAITDGTDVEDDETFRERILAIYRSDLSFVGCPADYVRWAKEISGVGTAVCIPEWDGPGTVKLVLKDSNGNPASEDIISDVYDYIQGVKSDGSDRISPIGATLTVVAPTLVTVNISCKIRLDPSYSFSGVESAIRTSLDKYYEEAVEDGELKYADIFAIITRTEGVYDAKECTLNNGISNVPLEKTQYCTTGTLNLTEY